jgi:hypothetical protein
VYVRIVGDIVAGQTTKADVLLALGEPDWVDTEAAEAATGNVLLGPRSFVYWQSRVTGGVAVVVAAGGGGAGAMLENEKNLRLEITFDVDGRVTSAWWKALKCETSSASPGLGADASRKCENVNLPVGQEAVETRQAK